MATRSTISIQNADGTINSVYCHWDGYTSNNGRILITHYNNEERARELISQGDISSLGPSIGDKHDFSNAPDGVCTFYGRDRGDKGVETRNFHSFADWSNFGQEYDYVFIKGKWMVRCHSTDDMLVLVLDQLASEMVKPEREGVWA